MFFSKILILSCIIIHYIMGKKHFVIIVYKLFSTEEILKRHIKECFKINGKQSILMPKKGEFCQFNKVTIYNREFY